MFENLNDLSNISSLLVVELEFAMRLRKDFVAVVVHSKFVPDGWLARAIGGKKVVDISSDDNMDSTLAALIQQLGTRGFLRSADYHDGI